jgi:hypothetical protein
MLRDGIDPRTEAIQRKAEVRRKQAATFKRVTDEYVSRAAPKR